MSKELAAKKKAQTVALTKNAVTQVEGVVYPKNYYEFEKLELLYKDKTNRSVDENGSKKYTIEQNVPLQYVTQLQKDLITLGYLPTMSYDKNQDTADGYFGGMTGRAVLRFKRHAKRLYRMKKDEIIDDVKVGETFIGAEDAVCNYATAKEIRKWIDKAWVNPVGRFELVDIGNKGSLRKDAAEEWKKIIVSILAKGGSVGQTYGDSLRPLQKFAKAGASNYSLHYSGRAVDLNQKLADPGLQRRYFVAKDEISGKMYWRIFCKTEMQNATQGIKYEKGKIKFWDFFEKKEKPIPEGFYLDITAEIEVSGKFLRIPAWNGWESNSGLTEWWHYYYSLEIQPTFLDEMELIGFTEADVRQKGWKNTSELDHEANFYVPAK